MHRLVSSFVFSNVLLSFAVANDVERPLSLQDQCLELNIANLEEYISTLNSTYVPTIESMIIGFELPVTALPFGILRSDWARLLLLRDAQEKGSIFAEKLDCLFKLLIVAYQRLEESLIPRKSYVGTDNSSEVVPTRIPIENTSINVIADRRDGTNENKTDKNGKKEDDDEYLSTEINKRTHGNNARNDNNMENRDGGNVESLKDLQNVERFTGADCLENTIKYSFSQRVNKLLTNTDFTMKITNDAAYNGQDNEIAKVRIYNELNNEKGVTIPLTISTLEGSESENMEVPVSTEKIPSLSDSTSTVKSDYAITYIEEFNSIGDTSSTVRTEIIEGMSSRRKEHTKGTKNDGTNVNNLTNIYETNRSDGSFDSSRSIDFNGKSNGMDGVSVKESFVIKDPYAKNKVNDLTNRQDFEGTISSESSILKNDNPTYAPTYAGTNSMDYFDPSWNSIYDVFTHKPDTFYTSIDRFHHKVGDKLKRLPVFRKQPSGLVTKDHKANVEVSSLLSKTITFMADSIAETNKFEGDLLDSRKCDHANTNVENNFRFFYNYGGRPEHKN